jgi:hypothetical protein
MLEGCSKGYKQAIAVLAQKIYDSGILDDVKLDLSPTSQIWDKAVRQKPELESLVSEVGIVLDSYQKCNAVAWVIELDPNTWKHLLP